MTPFLGHFGPSDPPKPPFWRVSEGFWTVGGFIYKNSPMYLAPFVHRWSEGPQKVVK